MGTPGLTIRITHPFHPLKGQTFDISSPHWGDDRVIYQAADGTLPTIAAAMTDMEHPDAFRRVAAGRAAFRTVDLLDLLTLLDRVSAAGEGGGCVRFNAPLV